MTTPNMLSTDNTRGQRSPRIERSIVALCGVLLANLTLVACTLTNGKETNPAIVYRCDRGEDISVVFPSSAEGSASLLLKGNTIELPKQSAMSGFLYSNGRYSLRGKGEELLLEIGRMAPIKCAKR